MINSISILITGLNPTFTEEMGLERDRSKNLSVPILRESRSLRY